MEFSRPECLSLLQGIFPTWRLQEDSLPAEPQGKPSSSRGGLRPTEQEEREKVGKWAAGECAHSGAGLREPCLMPSTAVNAEARPPTQSETGRQRKEDASQVTSRRNHPGENTASLATVQPASVPVGVSQFQLLRRSSWVTLLLHNMDFSY